MGIILIRFHLLFNFIKKQFFYSIVFFISFFLLSNTILFAQGLTVIKTFHPVTALDYTGDKPQSKTWKYGGYWWTVIPVDVNGGDPAGTYLYRLDNDTTWTKLWRLDATTNIKSDVKAQDNVTHIILKNSSENSKPQFQQVRLISIEFVAGSPPTYQLWSARNTTVLIDLKNYAETATIDIDSQGRMWLATDGGGSSVSSNKDIYVKYSDSPYSNWSTPIDLNSPSFQVTGDDICSIIAFGGNKVGVFWSDQVLRGFRFSYHTDGDSPTSWSTVVNVYVQGSPGGGAGDDHLNLAAGSDGTIYAAIKTSFDTGGETRIGLLVRRPSGWDTTLYPVTISSSEGTRPIVLLNEINGVVSVFYSPTDAGGDIRYKESSINPISFPGASSRISNTSQSFNNVSSTKQNVDNEPIILYTEANPLGGSAPPLWTGAKLIINRDTIDTYNGAGYAYRFGGISGQGISVNKTSLLNSISSAVTLEAWFKTNTTADQEIINYMDSPPDGNEGYALSLTATGKIRFQLHGYNPNPSFYLDSPSNYNVGEWTYAAGTYDESQSSVKLYVNGEEVASATYGLPLGNGNSDDFVIGAADDGGPSYVRPFNGSLDELRLWNVARSENDIRTYMSRKINPSSIPSSLIGYWNFDKPRTGVILDISGNLNDGSLVNIPSFQFEWSGAPIGDDSQFDYTVAGGIYTQQIGAIAPDTDYIEATAPASSGATGIQVYRVDAPPLRQGVPGLLNGATSPFDKISPFRYYGVKVIGSGTPTYDVVYHYQGHPGISNESNLKLAFRNNLADDSWEDLIATLNVSSHTLSKSGLTGTEFALASTGGNPLPVELSSFEGEIIDNIVKLNWRTETEVRNYGFDIEKSLDGIEFNKIGFVEGNGNSNSPKHYSFSDPVNSQSGKIFYRLKQIDNEGSFAYSKIVTIYVGVPQTFELFQNYPNPFNPTTKISFQLPQQSKVVLKVFNTIGEEVAELLNEDKEAGYYEVNFNAKNLASGVYIYVLSSEKFLTSKKMLLIK